MNIPAAVAAYNRASKRLLLLDYDGVLVPIMPTPDQAAPNQQTYAVLKKLTADPRNTCVIISGRPHETLQKWLGDLPLSFAAEHGLWRKEQGGDWIVAVDAPKKWKHAVQGVMSAYQAKLPGAFIEEKYAGLAFHYRAVKNPELQIEHLIDELQKLLSDFSLRLMHGKKVVEVVPSNVDKGTAAKFWINAKDWEFIAGAGDDTTDEALFQTLPADAYSVKVGSGQTAARFTVRTQSAFMEFLDILSNQPL